MYDAWCYVKGIGNADETALHGVTELLGAPPGEYLGDLPHTLESLTFGLSFNHSLEQITLPNGLQSLTFHGSFNQRLEQVTLPSLQNLTFSDSFDQSLGQVTLPNGLRNLTFGIIWLSLQPELGGSYLAQQPSKLDS